MFKLDSDAALLKSFRPRDRKLVELAPELKFPRFVHHYLAWTHPAGSRIYLVFATPKGAPTGIVFDSNGGAAPTVPQMCSWCHCSATGSRVALLSAAVNSKRRVGVYVCSDLGCQARLEDEANRSGASPVPGLARLLERMGRFATEALKIDLSGRGR